MAFGRFAEVYDLRVHGFLAAVVIVAEGRYISNVLCRDIRVI